MNVDRSGQGGDDEALSAALEVALRRTDRPQHPSETAESRIRSSMLDRFDAGARLTPTTDDDDSDVAPVVLEIGSRSVTDPPTRSIASLRDRRRTRRIDLARAAAAAVVLLLGALLANRYVVTQSEEPVVARPGPEQEDADSSIDAGFCAEYLGPLAEALGRWGPSGDGSESRSDVIEAAEVAIQAFIDIERPVELPPDSEWLALQEEAAAVRLAARGTDQVVADEKHRELIAHLGDALDRVSWSGDDTQCASDRLVVNN